MSTVVLSLPMASASALATDDPSNSVLFLVICAAMMGFVVILIRQIAAALVTILELVRFIMVASAASVLTVGLLVLLVLTVSGY